MGIKHQQITNPRGSFPPYLGEVQNEQRDPFRLSSHEFRSVEGKLRNEHTETSVPTTEPNIRHGFSDAQRRCEWDQSAREPPAPAPPPSSARTGRGRPASLLGVAPRPRPAPPLPESGPRRRSRGSSSHVPAPGRRAGPTEEPGPPPRDVLVPIPAPRRLPGPEEEEAGAEPRPPAAPPPEPAGALAPSRPPLPGLRSSPGPGPAIPTAAEARPLSNGRGHAPVPSARARRARSRPAARRARPRAPPPPPPRLPGPQGASQASELAAAAAPGRILSPRSVGVEPGRWGAAGRPQPERRGISWRDEGGQERRELRPDRRSPGAPLPAEAPPLTRSSPWQRAKPRRGLTRRLGSGSRVRASEPVCPPRPQRHGRRGGGGGIVYDRPGQVSTWRGGTEPVAQRELGPPRRAAGPVSVSPFAGSLKERGDGPRSTASAVRGKGDVGLRFRLCSGARRRPCWSDMPGKSCAPILVISTEMIWER